MSVKETQYADLHYAHIQISEGTQLILMAFIPVYCIAESIGGQNIRWICQEMAFGRFLKVLEGF